MLKLRTNEGVQVGFRICTVHMQTYKLRKEVDARRHQVW